MTKYDVMFISVKLEYDVDQFHDDIIKHRECRHGCCRAWLGWVGEKKWSEDVFRVFYLIITKLCKVKEILV